MLTSIGVQKWILYSAFSNREYWPCNNFHDKLGSVLGTSITEPMAIEVCVTCSFLSSSIVNNKLWFSEFPPSLPSPLPLLPSVSFWKPVKAHGFRARALWWLFQEVRDTFVEFNGIFGGLSLWKNMTWGKWDIALSKFTHCFLTLQETLQIAICYF